MQTNPLPNESTQISRIGLGCWQLGGNWGDVSFDTAEAILATSIENGVTFFDTADVYGAGKSETIIGDFLRREQLQDKIFVATKVGRSEGIYPDGYNLATVRAHVEACLKRLQTDRLELVQLHCVPTATMQGSEIWDILETLKSEGKIKRYGASVETVAEAHDCLAKAPSLSSLQVIFNLFRQKPARELFETAQDKGVAIIARVPLASGLLTGKLDASTVFGETDHRNFNRDGEAFNVGETFAGVPFETGVALVEELKQFVPNGLTLAQLALRWILDHPAVTTVIPGASRPEQAQANAAIADIAPLSIELHTQLSEFYEAKIKSQIRGRY